MAFLTADKIMNWNGVTVKQHFVTDKGHNPNNVAIPGKMTESVLGTTLHNTGRINAAAGTTQSEQYLRATVNGNMGTTFVHLYVDDVEAWLGLPLDNKSWHAGQQTKKYEKYGSENGNNRTISVECIMDGSGKDYDIKARDNAARIVAYLLDNYGGELYTHNYWCNIRAGLTGTTDALNKKDDGYKNCPVFIRPKWDDFKKLVESYRKGYTGVCNNTSNPNQKLYYVQVGAFSSKKNAEEYLKTVKTHYPAAFIKTFD